MSKIVQSINLQTEAVTSLGEFSLRGDGVACIYHSPRFQKTIETQGIWTEETGTLRPSDGQAFLDALPLAYANSSTIRVIDNDAGGHGKMDGGPGSGPRPGGGKGPEKPQPGSEHHAEAKEAAGKAKDHAQALRQVAKQHPEHEELAAKAEHHATKAREEAGKSKQAHSPDLAEHHATKAKEHAEHASKAFHGLKEKAEHEAGKEVEGGEGKSPGGTWRNLLKLLIGHGR